MGRLLKIIKTGQRRIYDFLLTKYGLALVVIGIFAIVFSLIQLSDTILEYRLAQLKRLANSIKLKNTSIVLELNYNKYSDEKYKQESDSTHLDYDSSDYRNLYSKANIDVVYTWVNGSDPEHLKQLRHFKMTNSQNSKSQNNSFVKIEFNEFLHKNADNEDLKEVKFPCYHKLCIQTNNLIVIVPQFKPVDKQTFLIKAKHSFDTNFYSNLSIFNFQSNHNLPLSVLHINSAKIYTNKTLLGNLNNLFDEFKAYKFYMAYYTIDCSLSVNCIANLNRTFVAKRLNHLPHSKTNSESDSKSNNLNSKYVNNRLSGLSLLNEPVSAKSNNETSSDTDAPILDLELPKYVQDNLIHKYDYVHLPFSLYDGSSEVKKQEKDKKSSDSDKSSMSTYLSVFTVNSRELEKNLSYYLSESFETDLNNKKNTASKLFSFSDKSHRNISYDLYKANIVWDLGDPFAEDVAENRFFDNDELKYSMRSVEKHAPWIRNVYLVTNGQVPNWLDLSHSKIKLITHEQIFLNKSHLPTFSSPAIESHLHRIKGLSKRFLYFNDDVLLTRNIWPDDFFTKSNGFKIHLAWALPGCNPNCPNNWIRDGYCDKACNTTECEFDGGDCTKTDKNRSHYDNARLSLMNETQKLFPDFYCSPGCSTAWLADKYCDNACNSLNCAFDMGDCGIENFEEKLFGVELFDASSPGQFPMHRVINVPTETLSFYLKFNRTSENEQKFRIIKAQYEEDKKIRTMSAVNKFGILTVLLMPSAYSETIKSNDVLKVYIDGTYSDEIESETNPLKVNLTINLNAFKKINISTTSVVNKDIDQQNSNETSSKPAPNRMIEKYTVSFDQIRPKLIGISADSSKNLVELYPRNLKFSHQFLQVVYENYFNYLNWSLSNEYLSQAGFEYKLNCFYSKLTNEINQTYTNMIENSDLSNDEHELLNQILLNNRTHLIDEMDKHVFVHKYLEETKNDTMQFRKRKLLDTFADSLRYVNKLFNQVYGYVPRRVPAHMPHFIDKHVMNDLQLKFKSEFEKTSANRLRTAEDMQFAFSYNYFLMSELHDFNASMLFDELDLNSNGYLDHFEIITINLRMSSRPFSNSDFVPHQAPASEMYKLNIDLSTSLNECIQNRSEKNDKRLSKESFLLCKSLVDLLKEHFWNNADFEEAKGKGIRYKYRFHTVGDEETKFVMIGGDPREIEVKLNNLIREPRKFICINDNIDYKLKHDATELKRLLANFYSTLFPLKSSFEKRTSENSDDRFSSTHSNLEKHEFDFNQEESENVSEKFDNKYKLVVKLLILVAFFILIVYVLSHILRCLRHAYNYLIYMIFKQKAKAKRREHKISNAFRKRMEMEASSSDTCIEEHEKRSSSQQSNPSAQSTASTTLRSKNFSSFNRKSNKKSTNTTII